MNLLAGLTNTVALDYYYNRSGNHAPLVGLDNHATLMGLKDHTPVVGLCNYGPSVEVR